MKKVYIKKAKINEDDIANSEQTQQTSSNQENTQQNVNNSNNQNNTIGNPNKEFDTLQIYVNNLKKDYELKKQNLEKEFNLKIQQARGKALLINKQLNAAGMNSRTLNEGNYPFTSIGNIRFSKKLFESFKGGSRVREIMELVFSAVQGAETHFTPTNPEYFKSYAKNINIFITNSKWSKEIIPKNHWDELEEKMRDEFIRSNKFNYYDKELDRIMDLIKDRFFKSESLSWIFGNE